MKELRTNAIKELMKSRDNYAISPDQMELKKHSTCLLQLNGNECNNY